MKSHQEPRIADPLEKLLKEQGILQDVMSDAMSIAANSGILYHSQSNKFYMPREGGGYATVPWSGCKTALLASGVPSASLKEEMSAALKAILIKKFAFDTSLNLAGYPAGLAEMPDGNRILVQRGMAMIEPLPGDPAPMLKFIHGLFDGHQMQIQTLLSWLKLGITDGLRCMRVGVLQANIRPSQVLIIVGPPGCGKTLLTKFIGEIFGNTRADPYPFMSGLTAFNGDLAEAALLVMDDVTESVMPRARHSLSQHLKMHTVNPFFQVHAKYCQPFSAHVFQRVVMLCNPDAINVLPAMSADFIDKVILMQAYLSEDIAAYRNADERVAWVSALRASLPAFVHYLTTEFEIPEELRDSRYGVNAYHARNLMSELRNEDNYVQLVEDLRAEYVIRGSSVPVGRLLTPDPETPGRECYLWTGSSKDFHQLVHHLPEGRGWRLEFSSSHAAGMALKHMADQLPGSVESHGSSGGIKRWKINLGSDSLGELPSDSPDALLFKMRSRTERTLRQVQEDVVQ